MAPLTLPTISKYLNEDVIDKAFKSKTKSEDCVKSVGILRAAPIGEGLLSAVYRIQVSGKNHVAKFIAKGLVNDRLMRKSLDCAKYFKREAFFFSTLLPTLCDFQKALGAKESIQNVVPIFYGSHIDGTDDFILMEDMSETECSSITEHPTRNERDLILKTLGHLHAVSFALRIKKPEIFSKLANELDEVYYNEENRNWYAKFFKAAIDIDVKVIAEVEGTESVYYRRLIAALNDDVYGHLIRIVSSQGDHPVFNHGDAWCPNFLVSKDKAVAIDFQLVRCTSPVNDLATIIIQCSNQCCSKEDFYEAVKVYYKALDYYLTDMGMEAAKIFTMDMLKEELKRYGKFAIISSLTTIPLWARERSDTLRSLENLKTKYCDVDRIPLEEIWPLTPIKLKEHRMSLVNAIRVAVDVGLI